MVVGDAGPSREDPNPHLSRLARGGGSSLVSRQSRSTDISGLSRLISASVSIPAASRVLPPSSTLSVNTISVVSLSLIHISEPTRLLSISYAVFCLKKKKKNIKS
eukprot:TRINITY_DN25219_c0_g1_i6.p2 TRINITY_DN25219_c0_g1~~TRINITY_DN25219_c0_g1_i6.p2  ORF type:complete len:105 (+),score=30.77 TRINITY_DN25219_c0_g1_i6:576-890(+)